MKHAPQRHFSILRPASLSLWVLAWVLGSSPAQALEVSLNHPQPTPYGQSTVFTVEVSDPVGTAQVRWDFGDGTVTEFSAEQSTVEHSYAAPGHYSVSALAQDDGGFASQSVIHTVHTPPTAGQPSTSARLLWDPARDLLLTANTDNNTVTLVDTTTLEKVAEIPVFRQPVALALAPDGKLWVLHQEDYAVAIVDLEERRAVDFFRLPYASAPAGLVFAPEGDAFVTLSALGEVLRLDGDTHEIIARQVVAPTLFGLSISGDGAELWATRFVSPDGRGEVYRLSADTLEISARYDLLEDTTTEDSDVAGRGLPNYLFSTAISPDGTRAWVPSKKDNMARGLGRDGSALTQDNTVRPLVSILDLTTDQELLEERIDLDDRNLPSHVAFSPLGDWAFISVFGSNLVEVRDAFDRSFFTALRNDKLKGPMASVLLSDSRLAVLAELERALLVFDLSDVLTGVNLATSVVGQVSLVSQELLSPEILRGKQVFANAEDKRMASEGYLSCASCHFDASEDGRVWDFTDRGEGFRNTSSLLGRRGTGHGPLHWSANFDEIQDFDGPIRAHQGGLGFISAEQFPDVQDPWGPSKAGLDPDLDALAAYVTSLENIPRSPYRNPDGTLTAQGEAGRELFVSLGCDACHGGDEFTDSADGGYYDVGTLGEHSGNRLGGELTGIDTPTLLGVWQTAPYLHDGSAATLRDVLVTSNPSGVHGATATLSEQELTDLEAYLLQIDRGLPVADLVLPTPEVPDGMGGAGGVVSEPSGGAQPAGGSPVGGGSVGGAPVASGGASAAGGDPTASGDEPIDYSEGEYSAPGCSCAVAGYRFAESSGARGPGGQNPWWSLLGLSVLGSWRRVRRARLNG